ncbi:MAG: hypothetical protein ACHREM_13700 [Polyangiales bacterium]
MSAPAVSLPSEAFDTLSRGALLTLRNPLTRPPFFLGLELVMITCAALTFAHAWRARRAGESWPLLLWTSTFAYGLLIELASYNFVDNFTHGPFSVMFYRDKLPLYVSVLYPVFIYTAAVTVRRFGLSRWAEPFAIGLLIVAIDFPFDVCGPIARWWVWADNDPNIAYRWYGVPVTSYYWHLAFGGILTLLCRALSSFVARRTSPLATSLALAFPIGAGTMILGVIAFLPFHLLKRAHLPDGLIVGALLAVSGVITIAAKKDLRRSDAGLPSILFLWFGYHLLVASVLAARGSLSAGRFVVILAALVIAASYQLLGRRLTSSAASAVAE